MTEDDSKIPESLPVAPVDPDFIDPDKAATTKGGAGWRDGLRDMARGIEFGVWISALFSAPVACALFGGSLVMQAYLGFYWRSIPALAAFAGHWLGIALTWSIPIAVPAGVVAWLYRGVAKRWLGRPGPDRPTRKRRRRRRWGVVAGLGLIAMVAGALGGNYLIRTSIRNADEAVAETDAIDPSWRLDDLLADREEVPIDEDSAIVADEVVELIGDAWPPETPKGEPRGVREALDPYTSMGEADDSRRLVDADAAAIRAELDDHAEAIELARTLVDYDRGRHEYEIGPTVLDTPLAETQAVCAVVRLLNADAILAAHDGEPDEALASCRAIIAAGRSIGDEPFVIGQLVRIAIDAIASRTARRVLGQGEPSDEALAALQELVLDERNQPRALWGLRGERAQLVEIIRRIGEGEMPISALSDGGASISQAGGGVSGLIVLAGWHQLSLALRWCNDLIAIVDRPEPEWQTGIAAWESRLLEVRKSRLGPLTATLPLLLMPATAACISAELRIRADLGSLAVLLAAERQRKATGRWPASVDEIDRAILPEPPVDPYTGEPFRLEYADGRLRVYSLGANLKDERGAYDPRKSTMLHVEDDIGTYAYDPELRGRPAPVDRDDTRNAEAKP